MHLKINVLNNQGHCCGKRKQTHALHRHFMLMGILSGAAIHAYATPTTVSAGRTTLRCSPICFCG
nr:Uncharacterised protein [Klebsiella pneumoniae]